MDIMDIIRSSEITNRLEAHIFLKVFYGEYPMTGNIRFIRFNVNASVADFNKEPKAKGKRFA